MEHNEDLARLELYVEKLIDSHNQLKNKNSEMYDQLQAKQQEITDLQEMVKNLQDDRSVMHNRVSGLLDRIDEWEKAFDQEEQKKMSESGDKKTKALSKKSSSLFNVASEQSSEPALR